MENSVPPPPPPAVPPATIPPPPPPKRKLSGGMIALIIGGLFVLYIILVVVYQGIVNTNSQDYPVGIIPTRQMDSLAVLLPEDIHEWVEGETCDDCFTIVRSSQGDGSVTLTAEYEVKDSVGDITLRANTTLLYVSQAFTNQIMFNATWWGAELGFKADTTLRILRNDAFAQLPQPTKHGFIVRNAQDTLGHILLHQQQKKTILFVVSGLYFSDPDTFKELLEPSLEGFAEWIPLDTIQGSTSNADTSPEIP